MNHLIILNHQPDIPPFMLTEMHCAGTFFEKIWYVNTRIPKNVDVFDGDEKYEFFYPTHKQRKKASIQAAFDFLSINSIRQIIVFIKDNGFKKKYFKSLAKSYAADRCIRPLAQRIINQIGADKCVVLSTWFGACAVTAAHLRKHNTNLKAYSLAHSYEILVSRSPYIPYYFVDFKHKYLDGIYFIADTMRQLYIEGVGRFIKEEYLKKMHVSFLGSIKEDCVLNTPNPECFNICTCSRMIPLKRLDILCEALRHWNMGHIKWTHLGSGETEQKIRQLAVEVMISNPLVEIVLPGSMANDQVKEFYKNNPIDVFCNLSTIEGVPISIMEAISYGIPVIATNVGGTKEIVTPEVGVLMDSDINAEKVKQVLESFVMTPEEEKNMMRSSAYEFWKQHFDAIVNSERFFEQIYI